ncbi:hypothetical protein [Lentiprolixibacter aurantiacus]|uniref:Uncharacterized protein n=1 Tax=Lentiprolixibacter aurantiacus TaxID=2993939 RepID=A0AAE3MMU0_9FLAO|nr:hypothetical protein [Lentiprolixibacter aurantiacus]MCX2720313.1 hypothetical protein [Lentiprolixibacter aurantiacus]
MKLVIVTVVEDFEPEVLRLFKEAGIEQFSGSDIDGYKDQASVLKAASWFPSTKGGVESSLFFSFTDTDKISRLFKLIEAFNSKLDTENPIRAVVVPIENYI